jgi:predicted DNA-binding helix-hairpin-helix protein
LRDYNFTLEELPFDSSHNLPLDIDPKLAWAQLNINDNPIDIARADYYQLVRVPGIGPRSAKSIIKLRGQTKLKDIHQLTHISVNLKRAAPFITLNGKKPAVQLSYL